MAKRVLILSGGGSKGAFQAGVIDNLTRSGWIPDAVAGISVGALNGLMVATGQADKLVPIWEDLTEDKVLNRRGVGRTAGSFILHKLGLQNPTLGFFDNTPLRDKIRRHVGRQFTSFFYCGTVNIHTGRYHEHRATPGMVPFTYIEPVLASTAIPIVFDPVRLNGFLHVDGGVRHVNPIGQILKDHSPEEVVIVTSRKLRETEPEPRKVKDLLDIATQSLNIMMEEIFEKDIREFIRINRLVRQATEQNAILKKSNGRNYVNYKATLYQPEESLGDSLNFSTGQARDNIRIGKEAVGLEL